MQNYFFQLVRPECEKIVRAALKKIQILMSDMYDEHTKIFNFVMCVAQIYAETYKINVPDDFDVFSKDFLLVLSFEIERCLREYELHPENFVYHNQTGDWDIIACCVMMLEVCQDIMIKNKC